MNDRGTYFVNDVIKERIEKYKTKHHLTSSYYLQVNGQTEKTNGITKIM